MASPAARPPLVVFPFVGDAVGGSHVSALELIRRLDPMRYRTLVVLNRPDGPVAALCAERGLPFVPSPAAGHAKRRSEDTARDAALILRQAFTLRRFLRERGAAVVHTNDGRAHTAWALPAKLAGARLVWHHRADPDARGLRYLAPALADRVLSVSRFASPKPGRYSAAARTEVVHSPFDTTAPPADRAAARAALLAEAGMPRGTFVAGFFGNLVERKRPAVFVDAIAALRGMLGTAPLLAPVFGGDVDGQIGGVRARAEAKGIADVVRFMGFRRPVEPCVAGCDAILVPAVREPFGRTLIEAQLQGTPLVAANSGGNPEIVKDGETGFLVPPDDPQALAERAARLLRDPDLARRMAEAGRREALERFGLDRHARAVMAIYDGLLAGGAPARDEGRAAPAGGLN